MQTAITTPTELLKIRLQLQTKLPGMPGYVGPLRLLRQVAQREGVTGAHIFNNNSKNNTSAWRIYLQAQSNVYQRTIQTHVSKS